MRVVISGNPGTGKTTVAKLVAEKLGIECFHLNELARDYKIAHIPELKTHDFDLEQFLDDVEPELEKRESFIAEGHFSHFIRPELVDFLVVINRDLPELKREYKKRGYPEEKIKENLQCEVFEECYLEAIEEGFPEEKIVKVSNDRDLESVVGEVMDKIRN